MTLEKDTKILIIGLGVMGGSYARALTKKGFFVRCITKDAADVEYALKEGIIAEGTTEVNAEWIGEAELIVFALYPLTFISWIPICIRLTASSTRGIPLFSTPSAFIHLHRSL